MYKKNACEYSAYENLKHGTVWNIPWKKKPKTKRWKVLKGSWTFVFLWFVSVLIDIFRLNLQITVYS